MNKEERAAKIAKRHYIRHYLRRFLTLTEFEDRVDRIGLRLERDQVVQALDYAKEYVDGNYEL
jgi:hypothetical protein